MIQSLWSFSLQIYKQPGVEEACLTLQDSIGADINILMYCCWRGEISNDEIKDLVTLIPSWQNEVVKGLRDVRRKIKQLLSANCEPSRNIKELRGKVAALELESEKIEQTMLSSFAKNYSTGERSKSASRSNLLKYTSLLSRNLNKENKNALAMLLNATFSDENKPGDSI